MLCRLPHGLHSQWRIGRLGWTRLRNRVNLEKKIAESRKEHEWFKMMHLILMNWWAGGLSYMVTNDSSSTRGP